MSFIRCHQVDPVVLIKANVCRLLESGMKKDGLNLLNGGRAVSIVVEANHKPLLEMLTVDSLQWIAPI